VKNVKIIVSFLLLFFSVVGCGEKGTHGSAVKTKPLVAITTFALYDVVRAIGAKEVELVTILPFGVDPHSFEPTPKLMAKIERADIVFYSGAGLEPWVENLSFKHKAVDVSKYVVLRKLASDEFEFHQHHDNQCSHTTIDPHYWLDFTNMKRIAHLVATELIELVPQKKALFLENEKKYIHMLAKLEKAYQTHLSSCRQKSVVISHNALGYLAQKYHFKVDSLTGLSPEAQPSAKDITRIMKEIHKEGVTTIFFEHFVNDKIVTSIAKDTGVHLDVFQPLGNITADEAHAGLTYEDIMYKNLNKLTKALDCN